ncbi:hypothetical protein NHX12_007794 [Muraenolepis orangiensis]|uniref:LRRNT domain-containing protein n=1 Tax=Muraenolepis orangiensis TaxID=630683 RepID=A0A9Q0DU61_9TELE|nr:hypothetical protein NHX12_007794 [Muraenolepis orangiensis]
MWESGGPLTIADSALLWVLLFSGMFLGAGPVLACPESCQCVEQSGLTVVQCASRNLDRIPPDLPRDTAVLLLSSNRITSIPDHAFRELRHLRELDLSDNRIETVDAGAFRGVADSLSSLDLSRNRLSGVPKEAFARLRATIGLSDNPWHCECSLQEMLRELRLDPETVNRVVCRTAEQAEHVGQPLIRVLDSGVNLCNFHRKTTDVAMLVTVFGWFSVVTGYVVYYVRHNRDDARRHLEYIKSLPGGTRITKDLDTVSTVM